MASVSLLLFMALCQAIDYRPSTATVSGGVVLGVRAQRGSRSVVCCVAAAGGGSVNMVMWNHANVVAIRSRNASNCKDRKKIIKSLKGHNMKLALSDYGCILLISIFSIVDDTKVVTKVVIQELAKHLKQLIFDKIRQTGNIYKNVKKIERGVAFPTCLSVNNIVCHFSPLATDKAVLEENDMIKIDMGCHIDGFIAVVAHTHVIKDGPVTERAADVLAAANTAAEVALRPIRHGKKVAAAIGLTIGVAGLCKALYSSLLIPRISQKKFFLNSDRVYYTGGLKNLGNNCFLNVIQGPDPKAAIELISIDGVLNVIIRNLEKACVSS
ncbi:hypothetical protein ABZP36_001922 [Zizania latifolia]